MSGPAAFALTAPPRLAAQVLDRRAELRGDEVALLEGWPRALVLELDGSDAFAVDPADPTRLAWQSASAFGQVPPADAVFLGTAPGEPAVHRWALRVEVLRGTPTDLRRGGDLLGAVDLGALTEAVAMLAWQRSARFDAVDGSETASAQAGWARASLRTGRVEYPRTDPSVIMLIHDGADRVLLAHQPSWPPQWYTVLAGFVEAGESLEAAVRREVAEEVGIDIGEPHYLGSQPWPFPRSLMMAFEATADPAQPLRYTDGEIADARWFTRAEVAAAVAGESWISGPSGTDAIRLPGPISIARTMLESWVAAAPR